MHGLEPSGKSKKRLQATIFRKQDELLENIADTMGRGVGTIHRWLAKMERKGPKSRHDGKSPQAASPEPGAGAYCQGRSCWVAALVRLWSRQLERQDARQAHMGTARRIIQPEVGPEAVLPARVFVQKTAVRPVQQPHARGAGGFH